MSIYLRVLRGTFNAVLVLVIALVLAEGLYRWQLSRDVKAEIARRLNSEPALNFSAYGVAPWRFDREMGFSYVPQPWRAAQINDGHFSGCSSSGRGDPFGNYDLGADGYRDADVRLAIFGSSYSMVGYSQGRMVSHLLSEKLSAASGKRVHTLNFSRDSTGVLTYFDTARAAIPKFRPDAAIFLINVLGMGYARHWRSVLPTDDGFRRLHILFEPIENIAENPRSILQPAVVNDDVTEEWCLTANDKDPLVAKLINEHARQYRDQPMPRVTINYWRLDRSFAANLLRHGDPYHRMRLFDTQSQYSAHGLDRFTDDAGFRAAVAELRHLRIPVVLAHIPILPEMRRTDPKFNFASQGISDARGRSLVADLEAATGERFVDLYDLYPTTAKNDPMKLVASEQDWHPSVLGTEAMAEALAQLMLDRADIKLLLSHQANQAAERDRR